MSQSRALPSSAVDPRRSTPVRTWKGTRRHPGPYTFGEKQMTTKIVLRTRGIVNPSLETTLPEPVFNGGRMPLVFLRDEEPHKVLVAHSVPLLGSPSSDGAAEDAVDYLIRER